MKRLFIAILALSLLTACGKNKSPKQIAGEICDCSKKANAMDPSDPKRKQAQDDCQKMNVKAWEKIRKQDIEKVEEFNKVLGDCASEQIRKSFGQ